MPDTLACYIIYIFTCAGLMGSRQLSSDRSRQLSKEASISESSNVAVFTVRSMSLRCSHLPDYCFQHNLVVIVTCQTRDNWECVHDQFQTREDSVKDIQQPTGPSHTRRTAVPPPSPLVLRHRSCPHSEPTVNCYMKLIGTM